MKRIALLGLMALGALRAAHAEAIRLNFDGGVYGEVLRLIGLGPEGGELRYRFDGGPWLPMTRELELCAFPGEERRYRMSFRALGPDGGIVEERDAEYRIDLMPPERALIFPSGGVFKNKARVEIHSGQGDRLFWAIARGDSALPLFEEGAPGPIELLAPQGGVAYYRVYAFAKDGVGNAGPLSEASFAVYSEGLAPPAIAPPEGIQAADTTEPPEIISIDPIEGGLRVSIRAKRLFVALQEAGKPLPGTERYVEWPISDSIAAIELKAPLGYSAEFDLFASASPYGVIDPSRAKRIKLENLPRGQHGMEAPDADLRYASGLGGLVVSFGMAREGSIRYQVGSNPSRSYEGPFGLGLSSEPERLLWWIERDGARGPERSLMLPRAPGIALPLVRGLPEGGVANSRVTLSADASTGLRYEASEDGSPPSPVSATSRPFEGPLSFDAAEGQDVAFRVRIRSFMEGTDFPASDELELRFRVDKAPPPTPSILGIAERATYDAPRPVRLDSPGADAYYRVIRAGEPEPEFVKYHEPFVIGRGDEERSLYRVEAYAIDAAGNRSAGLAVSSCTIDSASLYVAASGSDANPGSVDQPLASLEKAIALAQIQGRRFICVQGASSLGVQARVAKDISIIGGYSADWAPSPESRASISIGPKAGFLVEGASLSLKQLDFSSKGAENPLVHQSSGSLSVSSCSFSFEKPVAPRALSLSAAACSFSDSSIAIASAQRDHVALSLSGCRDASLRHVAIDVEGRGETSALALSDSRLIGAGLELAVKGSARAVVIKAASSELSIESSNIVSGPGNALALGLSASSSSAELSSTRLSIGASEGGTAISAEAGRISLMRCAIVSEGLGPRAFFYGLLVSGSSLRIASSLFDIGAANAPVALSAARSNVEVRHASIIMRGRGAQALSFDAGSLALSNSALYCLDGAGAGILALGSSASFTIDAGKNAAWGFGAIVSGKDAGLAKTVSDALMARLVSEVPAKSFSGSSKDPYALKAGSALIGAGSAFDAWPLEDYSGKPWGDRPDIGAQAYKAP